MNEIYKDKLEILRQRIPVGIRHGLPILEKVNGDLKKAEEFFQEEMLAILICLRNKNHCLLIHYINL